MTTKPQNDNKRYMVLDSNGNPIMRYGDEANPYIFYNLRRTFKFAEKELKTKDILKKDITIVEIKQIERLIEI